MQCLGCELVYYNYFGILTILQIGTGICAVPTADAVATGEINCYYFIVRLRSFSWFADMVSQGYCNTAQRSLACEGVSHFFYITFIPLTSRHWIQSCPLSHFIVLPIPCSPFPYLIFPTSPSSFLFTQAQRGLFVYKYDALSHKCV